MRAWNYYLEFFLVCIFRLYTICVYIPDDIGSTRLIAGEFL